MAQAHRDAFLERAACFALTSSPSTSAFLMAEWVASLVASNDEVGRALKTTCCLACGCLSILGWTSSPARKSITSGFNSGKRGAKPSRRVARANVVHTCHLCHRKTVMPVQKPAELKTDKSVTSNKPVPAKPAFEEPNPAKSTAKQRAKDRKTNQGLQALVRSKREQKTAASKSSFDLMDFMKA